MKPFVLTMLLGVGLATLVVIGAARTLLPATAWGEPTTRSERGGRGVAASSAASDFGAENGSPFTTGDAIEVVAARLGAGPKAERMRQTLRAGAKVEYHSPRHWTVRLNEASWTAHGVGVAYAEPDNDPAAVFEHEATGP